MSREKKDPPAKIDLETQALIALEQARNMKPGAERTEAMKRAGILRNAADLQGLFFAKRGRPTKTWELMIHMPRQKRVAGNTAMTITESFDTRTLANMEVALERACKILAIGSEQHDTRRHIASRILECAESGDRTLGGLTEAGRVAASELSAAHGA
jgi:hypothetical protein